MGTQLPLDIAATIHELHDVSIVKNFIVASAALFVYDTILTLPNEVRYIWRSKWRPGKVLYLATRYPVFIDVTTTVFYWTCRDRLSEKVCDRILRANAWLFILGTCIAETILSLRTYALWERSSRILIFLSIMTTAFFITLLVNVVHFLNTVKFIESPAPSILPCDAVIHRTTLYVNFALVAVYEFVIILLTFWKGFKQWRRCRSPVMSTLYRDGILIFSCLFAVSTTNLMLFLFANLNSFYDILVLSQRVIHAILSARVVLHLRIAAAYEKSIKLSSVAFTEPANVDRLGSVRHRDLHSTSDGGGNDTELRDRRGSKSSNNSSMYSDETGESSLT